MNFNDSSLHAAAGVNPSESVKFPSTYYFLPHLLDDPNSLKLGYLMSRNRNGVSLVMGVPTVRREKQSYLMDTLQNLVDGLTEEEANDSLIVVFVGEVGLIFRLNNFMISHIIHLSIWFRTIEFGTPKVDSGPIHEVDDPCLANWSALSSPKCRYPVYYQYIPVPQFPQLFTTFLDQCNLVVCDNILPLIWLRPQIEAVPELQDCKYFSLEAFPVQVDSGLIEVVAPSPGYYPNFDKLQPSLGDPPERVRWRSKQNLDFAFLMSYCQPKGTFYVQLEDDILAKPSYVTIMKKFAIEKIARQEPWFVLDFCQLGFIGKMFKSAELPWLIQFFQMFFNDKPVDWLLDHLITTKICNWNKKVSILIFVHFFFIVFKLIHVVVRVRCGGQWSRCWDSVRVFWAGVVFVSVLSGTLLQVSAICIPVGNPLGCPRSAPDKQFGKVALFFPHSNPEAEVTSGIKHYKQYTLKHAYLGENFFWGLLPQPGDQLVFNFMTPIIVKRFYFRSGNAEHPSDKFYNTTVEVLPVAEVSQKGNSPNITSDGYIIVGKFDSTGIATGTPNESIGKVKTLRLNVHSESENWAILSEIHIQDELSAR
nr:alpha-1,3-mannosyl-glycoprotein 4-beta-N-acetylglucosaminyltransferase B-like [Leptinotarsa decemlineata]